MKKTKQQAAEKPRELRVDIEGKKGTVPRDVYVKAKTKQLREFGYPSLTEADVDAQVDAVLAGKEFGHGLTVIGVIMKGEVLP